MAIDSYRFLDFASRQVMKAWAARQEPGVIPFTPLAKPLSECTVTLLSTAGVARNDDLPFDQEGERRNPWWGDPSFRVIPLGTTEKEPRRSSPPTRTVSSPSHVSGRADRDMMPASLMPWKTIFEFS